MFSLVKYCWDELSSIGKSKMTLEEELKDIYAQIQLDEETEDDVFNDEIEINTKIKNGDYFVKNGTLLF